MFGIQMDSGRIGVFQMVDVERPGNPNDMFFATVEDIGYLNEN
ncbi:hypothetical protein [Halorarum halophilum]|nr:hypothetical protein [Halobaculum halophilum]